MEPEKSPFKEDSSLNIVPWSGSMLVFRSVCQEFGALLLESCLCEPADHCLASYLELENGGYSQVRHYMSQGLK